MNGLNFRIRLEGLDLELVDSEGFFFHRKNRGWFNRVSCMSGVHG